MDELKNHISDLLYIIENLNLRLTLLENKFCRCIICDKLNDNIYKCNDCDSNICVNCSKIIITKDNKQLFFCINNCK
jgi:hypothetical protein